MLNRLFALLILVAPSLTYGGSIYSFQITGIDGAPICCSKNYRACGSQCTETDGKCLGDCQKKHCLRDPSRCAQAAADAQNESPSKTPEVAPRVKPVAGAGSKTEVRYDGRLTGPGEVSYEATNQGDTTLTILGIVFGQEREKTGIKVMKETKSFAVLPGKVTKFSLAVTDAEYKDWSKRLDALTIAITFPPGTDGEKWQYVNLLTPQDAADSKVGKFKVKGAFKKR